MKQPPPPRTTTASGSRSDSPVPPGTGPAPSTASPSAIYARELVELEQRERVLGRRDHQLSTARGLGFVATAGGAIYCLLRSTPLGWTIVAAMAGCFVVLVVRHARLSTRQFDLQRRILLRRRGLERIAGRYHLGDQQAAKRGDHHCDDDHPYSSDLDLFGESSLFELLNTTQTPGGAHTLAAWLTSPAPAAEVKQRQQAARELAARPAWREQLTLAGMRAARRELRHEPLIAWAATTPATSRRLRLAGMAGAILAVCTSLMLALAAAFGGPWSKAWLWVVAPQVLLAVVLRPQIERVLAPVCSKQSPLGTYRELLALVETAGTKATALVAAQRRLLQPPGPGASQALGSLDRLLGVAAVRHNTLVQLLVNALFSWDLWCGWLIARWRAAYGAQVAGWLEAMAEVEALAALGTFAFEHPRFAWPAMDADVPHLRAHGLGHPLIEDSARVLNDVALEVDAGPVLLITGSNMSGKSTMLRSIGVATVLAHAGAPVCARSLSLSPLRLFTSMRVGDALDRGVSRFYMEVAKLKRVVAALDADGPPLLFLLDEVLHGTNSRERNIGAKAVVRHLVARCAIGAVSSHDLGLVELEQLTAGAVRNVHFEDHLDGDQMCFDYQMKPGPVRTSNALRLMRSVGLDLPGLLDVDQQGAAPRTSGEDS